MILFAVQTHQRLTTRNLLLLHKCCNYNQHGASLPLIIWWRRQGWRLPTYTCLSQHQLLGMCARSSLLFSSPDTTRNLIKRNVWISPSEFKIIQSNVRSRHHTSFTAPVQVTGKDTCGTSFCMQLFAESLREYGWVAWTGKWWKNMFRIRRELHSLKFKPIWFLLLSLERTQLQTVGSMVPICTHENSAAVCNFPTIPWPA